MGIHDRDYMRDNPPAVTHSANAMMARAFAVGLGLILAFLCLRIPSPLYIKIPVLVGVAFLVRFLWLQPRKGEGEFYLKQGIHAEKQKEFDRALRCYELAVARLPADFPSRYRLLSLYDATNRKHKAERFVKELHGLEVPARDFEPFEHLVLKYRPARFVENGETFRLELQNR